LTRQLLDFRNLFAERRRAKGAPPGVVIRFFQHRPKLVLLNRGLNPQPIV